MQLTPSLWRRGLVALLAAVIGSACSRNPRTGLDAGAFSISRTQHSYSNWNTGSTTTYYAFDVQYRRRGFSFDARSHTGAEGGRPIRLASSQIAYVFVVSEAPSALLVVAGDPNNDASWNLLVDTPDGLRAEHVAFYGSYAELAWLDGEAPAEIKRPWDQLTLDGGRWLWIGQQTLLDRTSLEVRRLASPNGSRDGAAFVAFSPDRQRMARLTSLTDPQDFRKWRSVILVNELATGRFEELPIESATMWFDDSRDIDAIWLDSYFEWRRDPARGYALQQRSIAKPRPYRGRTSVVMPAGATQYHVPRIDFAQRRSVMDFIARALDARYTMDEAILPAAPPTATAAGAAAEDAAREPDPRTDAVSAPITDLIVRAELDLSNQRLAVYFSERGLSIENDDPALNDIVRRIAAVMDVQVATPEGRAWLLAPPPAG